jgi:hypothetical protein
MLTDSQVTDLKAKHGDKLSALECESGDLVFRKPKRADYERFINEVGSDKNKLVTAGRNLARSCLVFPEVEGKPDTSAFEAALDEQPGLLLSAILPAVHEMAGGAEGSAEVKKL